jgi:glucuronokinase
MVDTARRLGASAKFTGSGGAIVGTYKNEQMFKQLKKKLRSFNVRVIKPKIAVSKRKAGT